MDSGSKIDSFILGIAIFTTAGPGYYPFQGHTTLQLQTYTKNWCQYLDTQNHQTPFGYIPLKYTYYKE